MPLVLLYDQSVLTRFGYLLRWFDGVGAFVEVFKHAPVRVRVAFVESELFGSLLFEALCQGLLEMFTLGG